MIVGARASIVKIDSVFSEVHQRWRRQRELVGLSAWSWIVLAVVLVRGFVLVFCYRLLEN